MLEPSIPPDDAERVAALHSLRILDTRAEARFDRITRTVKQVFGIPIALISLVDVNRQWFKSRQGLDAEETPRNISFCAHAILKDDILVIPDAADDPRFADNPLVTGEPHIRFYAGVPLHDTQGYRMGTLCAIDRKTRTFTDAECSLLGNLARWAEQELNLYTLQHATALAREKEAQLQAIVDHAGEAIITLDENGYVESFNPAATGMFGYSLQDIAGKHLRQLAAPSDRDRIDQHLRDVAATPGITIMQEASCERINRSTFPAELTLTEMRYNGRRGYTVIGRDISERRHVEQLKDEFVSTVSHELRTPLTSIHASLAMLNDGIAGPLPPAAGNLLNIAHQSCERLVRLVNDVLDIEQMTSGKMQYTLVVQSLHPLVDEAVMMMQGYAAQQRVKLVFDAVSRDAMAAVDRDRILQVLTNLLSNAIKYSPADGEVRIVLETADGRLRLSIVDQGSGIPESFRSRIFQKFARVDSTDARQKGGTGLGLHICKTIIEHHGGCINFESILGQRTRFYFELPLVLAATS